MLQVQHAVLGDAADVVLQQTEMKRARPNFSVATLALDLCITDVSRKFWLHCVCTPAQDVGIVPHTGILCRWDAESAVGGR
jgi:hypothetical protein